VRCRSYRLLNFQIAGPGSNRKEDAKRRPGDRYDTKSYRKAITYAIKAANKAITEAARKNGTKPKTVPMWTPHQLRHTALTRARKEFGLEASSTFGGHKKMNVTEIYAEKNMALADKVAMRLG
jgi:integrase